MQRITPETSIKETYAVQQASKLKDAQNGFLASKGLSFKDLFSIDLVQFGTSDILEPISEKLMPVVEQLLSIQIENGMPEEVAKAVASAMAASFNPYAGLSEAVKTLGAAKFEEATGEKLPSDFFGAAVTKGEPKATEKVAVSISL